LNGALAKARADGIAVPWIERMEGVFESLRLFADSSQRVQNLNS
jgi:hypothetical protein